MSNREVDVEKQFQDDLEKATALSLETLALDEFRRSKLGFMPARAPAALSYNHIQNAPPNSPPRSENDLISFASPSVKQHKPEEENPALQFLKNLNEKYVHQPSTPQSMQLVPYAPANNQQLQTHQQLQTQQQQKLTNAELQKLYSMPPPTLPQYNSSTLYAPTYRQPVPSVSPSTYSGYYGFVVPNQPQGAFAPPQLQQQQSQSTFQPLNTEKALVLRTPSATAVIPSQSITRSNSANSISLAASMPSSAAAQVNSEMKRKLSKKQPSIVKENLIDLEVDE